MKSLVLAMLTVSLFAADPIPPAEHERISQEMLKLQQAQIQYQAAQLALAEQQQKYDAMVAALQAQYKAPGCIVNTDKTWRCPAAPAVVPAKK